MEKLWHVSHRNLMFRETPVSFYVRITVQEIVQSYKMAVLLRLTYAAGNRISSSESIQRSPKILNLLLCLFQSKQLHKTFWTVRFFDILCCTKQYCMLQYGCKMLWAGRKTRVHHRRARCSLFIWQITIEYERVKYFCWRKRRFREIRFSQSVLYSCFCISRSGKRHFRRACRSQSQTQQIRSAKQSSTYGSRYSERGRILCIHDWRPQDNHAASDFVLQTCRNQLYSSSHRKKKHIGAPENMAAALAAKISAFIAKYLTVFQSFDVVKIYYDNGQILVSKILHSVFCSLLVNVQFKKAVKPSNYRLFQIADMICTMELIRLKMETNLLSNSELRFFGEPRVIRRSFLKIIDTKKLQ